MGAIVSKGGQIGMAASSPATETYELISGDIGLSEELHNSSGIVGSLSMPSERTRQNTRRVSGSLTMHPNSVELDALLPRILGGSESTDSFPLAETLPTFIVEVARDDGTDGKVFEYSGCKCAVARFSASQGGPLELAMQIEGIDETVGNAGTRQSLTLSTVGPYMFSDAVISVGGVNYNFREWALEIAWDLDLERFLNTQTRTAIPERARTITWTFNAPYGDTEALYALAVGGVACVATFTNGSRSLAFSSTKVQFPRQSPQLSGQEEIMLPLEGVARKDGSTAELTCTNDSV